MGKRAQWGAGVRHSVATQSPNPQRYSADFIYAYPDLGLALLLNPIHRGFINPIPWVAMGEVIRATWDEIGVYTLTTVWEIPLPGWYKHRRRQVIVRFAHTCAHYAAAAPGAGPAAIKFANDAAAFAQCAESAPNITRAAMAAGMAALATAHTLEATGLTTDFVALAKIAIGGKGPYGP